MADYKKLYFELFNKVTDIIEDLKNVQVEMEEMYINEDAENGSNEEWLLGCYKLQK